MCSYAVIIESHSFPQISEEIYNGFRYLYLLSFLGTYISLYIEIVSQINKKKKLAKISWFWNRALCIRDILHIVQNAIFVWRTWFSKILFIEHVQKLWDLRSTSPVLLSQIYNDIHTIWLIQTVSQTIFLLQRSDVVS